MRFVLDIDPPRTTAQQKRIAGRRPDGRPYFYDGSRLSKARGALQAALCPHKPKEPLQVCVEYVEKFWDARGRIVIMINELNEVIP